MRKILEDKGARQALIELSQMVSINHDNNSGEDTAGIKTVLSAIAPGFRALANSPKAKSFCSNQSDFVLTDAIVRGKIIYVRSSGLSQNSALE